MIVLDLSQLAGGAAAADGYEGMPGLGGAASAPPGLFANLLSAEQLALMGAPPAADGSEAAAPEAGAGVTVPENPAANAVAQAAVFVPAAPVAAASPAPPPGDAAKPAAPMPVAASAVAPAMAAHPEASMAKGPSQTPAVAASAPIPPDAAEAPDPAAPAVEAQAGSPDSDGPLFAALPAEKGAPARPQLWVQTALADGKTAPQQGLASSANVVRLPARPLRTEQPDTVAPAAGTVSVESQPPADVTARSRAEVVLRRIQDAAAPQAPVAPAVQPQASTPTAQPAAGNGQPVEPVQVAQLDAQTAAAQAVPEQDTSLQDVDGALPKPELPAEGAAPQAAVKPQSELGAVKGLEPAMEAATAQRTDGASAAPAPAASRIDAEPGGAPSIRTPVTEFAEAAVKSVRYLVGQGENTMRIKLIPENLGEMQLVVRAVGEALHIHVAAAHAHAREAVEAQMQGLRDQLAKEGIEVARITVASDASGGQQFAQQPGNRDAFAAQQQFARDGAPWRGYGGQHQHASSNPDPPWSAAERAPRRHAGALNLFA